MLAALDRFSQSRDGSRDPHLLAVKLWIQTRKYASNTGLALDTYRKLNLDWLAPVTWVLALIVCNHHSIPFSISYSSPVIRDSRKKSGLLYLTPLCSFQADREVWYDSTPVGANTINNYLKSMASATGLDATQKRMTSHSVQKTTGRKLQKQGICQQWYCTCRVCRSDKQGVDQWPSLCCGQAINSPGICAVFSGGLLPKTVARSYISCHGPPPLHDCNATTCNTYSSTSRQLQQLYCILWQHTSKQYIYTVPSICCDFKEVAPCLRT